MAELTVIAAGGPVVIVIVAEPLQPCPVIQVAEYVFDGFVGVTLITDKEDAVDHCNVPSAHPEAVRLTGVFTFTFVALA